MRKISTGEPSTLRTYLGIAKFFGVDAEEFIQSKADEAPNGLDEEVVADERQVLQLLGSLLDGSVAEAEPPPSIVDALSRRKIRIRN